MKALPQYCCAECAYDLRLTKGIAVSADARRSGNLIEGLLAAEAARGVLGKTALISHILRLPSLQRPSKAGRLNGMSLRARLRCLSEINFKLGRYLMRDPNPEIAAWRGAIISKGGPYEFLEPLRRRLSNALGEKPQTNNPRDKRMHEIGFLELTGAYRDIAARRKSPAADE